MKSFAQKSQESSCFLLCLFCTNKGKRKLSHNSSRHNNKLVLRYFSCSLTSSCFKCLAFYTKIFIFLGPIFLRYQGDVELSGHEVMRAWANPTPMSFYEALDGQCETFIFWTDWKELWNQQKMLSGREPFALGPGEKNSQKSVRNPV